MAESAFVWGLDRATGRPWFLPDAMAAELRGYVKANVVCPVVGCEASLTAVHSSVVRDHLRHLSEAAGGHSPESLAHAQGCAQIAAWCSAAYPAMKVRREEYTDVDGERRADVMVTSPDGVRIAFEVQYSPLTVDAWQARHDSYQRQGVVDVWLFGHTTRHASTSLVEPMPMQRAVLRSGAPLLFLQPGEPPTITVTGATSLVPTDGDAPDKEFVIIQDSRAQDRSLVRPLSSFSLHPQFGLTSPEIEALRLSTEQEAVAMAPHLARGALLDRVSTTRQDAQMARTRRLQEDRGALQDAIRVALGELIPWAPGKAYDMIRAYFGDRDADRIDTERTGGGLIHWQCVLYFTLIAGCAEGFSVSEALLAVRRQRALVMEEMHARLEIKRFLERLRGAGLLHMGPDGYVPTEDGAWR